MQNNILEESFFIKHNYTCLYSIKELPEPSEEFKNKKFIIGNQTLGQLYSLQWDAKQNQGEWKFNHYIYSGHPLEQRLNYEIKQLNFMKEKLLELFHKKDTPDEIKQNILISLEQNQCIRTIYNQIFS